MRTRFAIALALCLAQPAYATPVDIPTPGYVTMVYAGWNDAYTRVQLDAPFYNPANCPLTDGYLVDVASPGARLFSSILVAAYSAHKKIMVTIDGCSFSRPRVIGLRMDM